MVPGQGATQCLSKHRADSDAITLKIRSTAGPARRQTNKMTECFSDTNSSFMQAPLRYMDLSLLKYQTPSDEMGMLHPTPTRQITKHGSQAPQSRSITRQARLNEACYGPVLAKKALQLITERAEW